MPGNLVAIAAEIDAADKTKRGEGSHLEMADIRDITQSIAPTAFWLGYFGGGVFGGDFHAQDREFTTCKSANLQEPCPLGRVTQAHASPGPPFASRTNHGTR